MRRDRLLTQLDRSSTTSDRGSRRRDRLVVLLAINSGATDAIGFISLGGAFTSVMTGNMVLLGVAAGTRNAALAAHSAAAIICFIFGGAVGARIAGQSDPTDTIWPSPVTIALRLELALLVIYAIGWESFGGHPHGPWAASLLGVNAAALGLQSSAILRFGVPGLSTTYLTGTLTSVVMRLTHGRSLREVLHSVQILIGLVIGASLGALLAVTLARAAPLVQLLSVGAVVLGATALHREAPTQIVQQGR